jgi:transposase InsO family protein
MALDVFSRKIVGWAVHEEESAEHAAAMVEEPARREGVREGELTLHADNGGPMKGFTLVAKLEALGIEASFSRPRTSDDHPFSEALFRTLKYRPEYPEACFASLDHPPGSPSARGSRPPPEPPAPATPGLGRCAPARRRLPSRTLLPGGEGISP